MPRRAHAPYARTPGRARVSHRDRAPKSSAPETRPAKYSLKLAEALCLRIEQGRTLEDVCADPDMPPRHLVNRWRRDREDFRKRFEQALKDRADLFADQMLDIVDQCPTGPNEVQKTKLRVEVRKLIMARDNPETYQSRDRDETVTVSFVDLVRELEERDRRGNASAETR